MHSDPPDPKSPETPPPPRASHWAWAARLWEPQTPPLQAGRSFSNAQLDAPPWDTRFLFTRSRCTHRPPPRALCPRRGFVFLKHSQTRTRALIGVSGVRLQKAYGLFEWLENPRQCRPTRGSPCILTPKPQGSRGASHRNNRSHLLRGHRRQSVLPSVASTEIYAVACKASRCFYLAWSTRALKGSLHFRVHCRAPARGPKHATPAQAPAPPVRTFLPRLRL